MKNTSDNIIIMLPWNPAFHNHAKKFVDDSSLLDCKESYSFGYFIAFTLCINKFLTSMSVSKINEKTGQKVNIVANPKLKYELNAGIET